MHTEHLLLLAAVALLLGPTQAEEQKTALVTCPQAGDFRAITTELENRDRQEMRGRGLSATGRAVVLFADGDMATWSVVVVTPNGEACVADQGTDLELLGAPGTPA